MKQTFDVTGMTCAACATHVEKATSGVSGVEGVAVNLLKNSFIVHSVIQKSSRDSMVIFVPQGKKQAVIFR